MSLQLPAILSPPTLCIPSSTLTVSPQEEVAEVALPFTGRRPVLGFALPYAGSPMHLAVSCSTLFYLWTGSSSQVASHPVLRRRSFLRLRTTSALLVRTLRRTQGCAHARPAWHVWKSPFVDWPSRWVCDLADFVGPTTPNFAVV
jgi:hypothetical protein